MSSNEFTLFDSEPAKAPRKASKDDIIQVFNFWVQTLRSSSRGPSPVLSPKRETKIRKALELYGLETCTQAILGCSLSDFHMGKNRNGRRYDDIELILRDSQHIEQFVQYYLDANTGGGFLDEE